MCGGLGRTGCFNTSFGRYVSAGRNSFSWNPRYSSLPGVASRNCLQLTATRFNISGGTLSHCSLVRNVLSRDTPLRRIVQRISASPCVGSLPLPVASLAPRGCRLAQPCLMVYMHDCRWFVCIELGERNRDIELWGYFLRRREGGGISSSLTGFPTTRARAAIVRIVALSRPASARDMFD